MPDQQRPYSVQQQPPPSASEVEVEYTKSGVPKACPDCGHPFHPRLKCYGDVGHCFCKTNMAVRLDIPAPSTGATAGGEHDFSKGPCDVCEKPATGLVLGRGRICSVECMRRLQSMTQADLQRRLLKTRNLAEVEVAQLRSDLANSKKELVQAVNGWADVTHEANALRLDLAHAQAERQDAIDAEKLALIAIGQENDQLRAQIEAMRDTLIEIARELHRTAHMTDVEWERCPAMKCRQSRAALDQQQQEVRD